MKHALAPITRHGAELLDLPEDEYARIAEAKDGLITLIGIEQKFDIVLENYAEYEEGLLNLAVRQVVFRPHDYASFQRASVSVTRRLSNLLSSARLYVDQINHDLRHAFGRDHEIVNAVRAKCSEEYDGKFGYRLMETLRNMMQHSSISGMSLTFSQDNVIATHGAAVRNRVIPKLSVRELREGGIKAAVRDELGDADYAEVSSRVREYVEGLTNVHGELRRRAAERRAEWATLLRATYDRGAEAWGPGNIRASDLIALDSAGKVVESRHIFVEPIDYLATLEAKNAAPRPLTRTYVSNASGPEDA